MKLRKDKRTKRQEQAVKRNKEWNQLSDEQKIQSLLSRPGESKKQIARIAYRHEEGWLNLNYEE